MNGGVFEVSDDPLFEVGTTYLLFLEESRSAGVYFVAGGPQGRFLVVNEQATSLSRLYPARHVQDLGLDHAPLAAIVQQMHAAH